MQWWVSSAPFLVHFLVFFISISYFFEKRSVPKSITGDPFRILLSVASVKLKQIKH